MADTPLRTIAAMIQCRLYETVTTHDDQTPSHDHTDWRVHATAGADEQWSRQNGLCISPVFDRLLRENHLDSLDALFANQIGERLDKPGLPTWRQRWRLTLRDPPEPPLCKGGTPLPSPPFARGEVGPRTLYLKRFTDPPASARREVRRSGTGAKSVAGLEWAWMSRLVRDGVPCTRPVALAEELRGSREVRSVIVTEAVRGDSLERWAAQWTWADRATVRALIGVLAKLVARLHAGGYVHRDLYLSHIFFDPAAPLADSLCLIDLQRMIRPTGGQGRWIVKDLAALNFSSPPGPVSRADRLRWLKLYLGAVKLNGSARRLAYRVIGKTLRTQRRETRRRPTVA